MSLTLALLTDRIKTFMLPNRSHKPVCFLLHTLRQQQTMLRRIRARRAARAERKFAKLQSKQLQQSKATQSSKQHPNSIFRSNNNRDNFATESPPAIVNGLTLTLSQDDSSSSGYDSPTTPGSVSNYMTSSLAFAAINNNNMSEALLLTGASKQKEIYDMKLVLEELGLLEDKKDEDYDVKTILQELKELHEGLLADKDGEILATQIKLAFASESLNQTSEELQQARKVCLAFLQELSETQKELAAKEQELAQTQSVLTETQESLQAANEQVAQHEQTLEEKETKLEALQKSLKQGTRSATAVMGLLTLGALLTGDE